MPKTNYCKPEKKVDMREIELKALIEAGMIRSQMDRQMLAKRLRMPYATLCSHLSDIRLLRYMELRNIFDVLNIPEEDRAGVL